MLLQMTLDSAYEVGLTLSTNPSSVFEVLASKCNAVMHGDDFGYEVPRSTAFQVPVLN